MEVVESDDGKKIARRLQDGSLQQVGYALNNMCVFV